MRSSIHSIPLMLLLILKMESSPYVEFQMGLLLTIWTPLYEVI